MASEIRVNKIENRSGLGTVTFADTGVDLAGIVTATTFSGSGASLTDLPSGQLSGTLPAISGANLTNLAAANLTGTIADARFPATLPAASAANLTNIPAANVTGTLPALTAANLTNIPAANLVGVCTSGLTKTGGFGALVPITATTVSSDVSGVTFTEELTGAFSDYKIYVVMIAGLRIADDNRDLQCRYRTGTNGSSQQSTNVYVAMTSGADNADATFSATSQWRFNYNNIGNDTDGSYVKEDFNAVIYFDGFEANRRLRYHGQTVYQSSDGNLRGQFINGHATDSTEVTGLEFFSSQSSNINLGKFSLFGVNG